MVTSDLSPALVAPLEGVSETITVLKSLSVRLAKVWRADGMIEAYQSAYLFAVEEQSVYGIKELSSLLFRLTKMPNHCIIRGQWRPDAPAPNRKASTRRLNVCFEDAPRHFLALDVDDFEPLAFDPLREPVEAAREFVETMLPPEFSGAAFHLQLSNSAGAPGNERLLKAHLWFWLSQPLTGAQLLAWQKRTGAPFDPALFKQVQIHYTAHPVFEGVADPLPLREMFVPGRAEVTIDLEAGDLKAQARSSRYDGSGSDGDDVSAWIAENWTVLGGDRKGHVWIECPFKDEHSSESGNSSTVYMPRGNGYARGHFKCLHSHCEHRSDEDFLRAMGVEAHLLQAYVTPILDPKDPLELASAFMKNCHTDNGHRTLIRNRETWYRYAGTHWVAEAEEELRARMWAFLSQCLRRDSRGDLSKFQPSSGKVSEALDALIVPAGVGQREAQCWLDDRKGADPKALISMSDGLLNVATRELEPHTPLLFNTHALPYARADAVEPVHWLAFLAQVWPNDQEAIDTLQEVLGYLVSGDTSLQKIFLIKGPKRSGKGTIGHVLKALVGMNNVAAPSLGGLNGNFALQPLLDKPVALIGDARAGTQANMQAAVEKLLLISGGDAITVDRKHKEPITTHLPTRFVITTNELPRLGDTSGAMASRFIVLTMTESFHGKEDHGLKDRLVAEAPGILGWALEGLDRLRERGRFVQPKSGLEDYRELAALNSPMSEFIEEMLDVGESHVEAKSELYSHWKSWCDNNGRRNPGTSSSFFNALRTCQPSVREGPRPGAGTDPARRRTVRGVRIKPDCREPTFGVHP